MRRALCALRSRTVYKALDAAVTARLRSPDGPRASRYERTRALTRALGLEARLERAILATGQLPFRARRVEPLAYGAASTVLLLRCADGDRVLKVRRASLGRSGDELLALARTLAAKERAVAARYAAAPGVHAPERFLVLGAHVLGVPAVAGVQRLVDGGRDLFDPTDDELRARLAGDPRLAAEVAAFARATRRAVREEELCLDLVGRENLLLVPLRDGAALRLVDAGFFRLSGPRADDPARCARALGRLARLERLVAGCQIGRTAPPGRARLSG